MATPERRVGGDEVAVYDVACCSVPLDGSMAHHIRPHERRPSSQVLSPRLNKRPHGLDGIPIVALEELRRLSLSQVEFVHLQQDDQSTKVTVTHFDEWQSGRQVPSPSYSPATQRPQHRP